MNPASPEKLVVNPAFQVTLKCTLLQDGGRARSRWLPVARFPVLVDYMIEKMRTGDQPAKVVDEVAQQAIASGLGKPNGDEVFIDKWDVTLMYQVGLRGQDADFTPVDVMKQKGFKELLMVLACTLNKQDLITQLPTEVRDHLVDLNILLNEKDVPRDLKFECRMDEELLELVPEWSDVPRTAELILNPDAYLVGIGSIPANVEELMRSAGEFIQTDANFWVHEPSTGMIFPYWVPESLKTKILTGLSSLSAAETKLLALSRILVPQGYSEARHAEWRSLLASHQNAIHKEKYTVVRGLFPPLMLAAFRRHLRDLRAEGRFAVDKEQVADHRSSVHNEKVSRFFQLQLARLMREITRDDIKPSYTYTTTYFPGAVLARHIDRPQCLWNISLLVDNIPEVSLEDRWPIYLDINGVVAKVTMDLGDFVVYSGTQIPHWRDALRENQLSTLVLCHFVKSDFEGSLN